MKGFVLKCILYSLPVIGLHVIAAYCADGFTDAYYLRFTSLPQKHLIVGSSRAAQGLRPAFISQAMSEGETSFFNYAFSLVHSPYGETYKKSIEKKITPDLKDGSFIVSVDPWSISAKSEAPEDGSLFNEWRTELGKTERVNMSPNFEYLMENYPKGWFRMILRKLRPSPSIHELHSDGWLEIDLSMQPLDLIKREKRKFKDYRNNMTRLSPSELRTQGLIATIEMLDSMGDVYLVRLPVPEEMLTIEDEYMPHFDERMTEISERFSLPYYNMTLLPDTFRYVDGNHLYRSSGKSVSRLVGKFIQQEER